MTQLGPTSSAIITVYNEKEWIGTAVDSLLNQTLSDIEILIVDDGSNDGTGEILDAYDDPRIRVIHTQRMRRAAALALAAEEARGEFVANLDADDECYPDRLERQVEFLTSNPDYGWVGCAEDRRDFQRGEAYVRHYPEDDASIRRLSARCIPYCHSGVMFRKAVINQGINYDPQHPYLIDFDFFLRVAASWKVANLAEPLVIRRARGESYFQRRFSSAAQNRRLAAFCRQAIRSFDLPLYSHVYPAARLVYPWFPTAVKRCIRASQGLSEHAGR